MAGTFFLDAAANAVGTLFVNYLVKPVERRVRYLFRLNKIVEELHEQEKNLTKEQTRVREDVEDAKRQALVIEKCVEDWLAEAEAVLNDVQSLENRIQEDKKCFHWCPDWSWRYKLSKEIEEKTPAIINLVRSSHFERYGRRAPRPGIGFFGSKGYLASKSVISAFNEIIQALKDDGVNMIGVWGMGGVGKTTLVTEVGKEAKSSQLFDLVIKAVVSQTPDIGKIQNTIAELIDFKLKNKTEVGKAEELWLRLKNEEKVLIILDDMWNELDLEKIGIPLFQNRKGCKIILTTRRRQVCEYMECQPTVQLHGLDEDEAWNLFKMNARLDSASEDITNVAEQVAKECDGLPVAIVTLARALRSKDLNGWQLALGKLKRSRLMDIGNIPKDAQKNAYLCLETSYNYLERDETKRCFLLCALYPEDYSIDMEDLVRHAWGLMLYRTDVTIGEVRKEVLEAINILKDSCLLLEADNKRNVKVHDVVRDVALWIASKEDKGLVMKDSRVESENENSKQKLEIFLLDSYDSKTPIEFFEGMSKLKVLSLKGESKKDNGFFSLNAIKSLTNLRALQLKDFKHIEDMSVLAELTKLEILCLDDCGVQESVDKLRELKNLRLLDISDCCFELGFSPKFIHKLVNLEEIYLHYSDEWIFRKAKISSAISLPELNLLPRLTTLLLDVPHLHVPQDFVFPRLERYSITTWSDSLYFFNKATMSRYLSVSKELPLDVFSELFWNVESLDVYKIVEKDIKCLTEVHLKPVKASLTEIQISKLKEVLFVKTKNLSLMKIIGGHNLIPEVDGEGLNELTVLTLKDYNSLEYLVDTTREYVPDSAFTNLVELNIRVMDGLKMLCNGQFPKGFLQNLEKLIIKGCDQLQEVFPIHELFRTTEDNYFSLKSLKVVEIYKCKRLKSLFLPSLIQSLLHLQQLVVEDCDELKTLFGELESDGETESNSNFRPPCLPRLKSLEVDKCPTLEYLLPIPLDQALPQLEGVRVWNCPQLKQVFGVAKQHDEDVQHSICINLPSLKSLDLKGKVRLFAFKEFLRNVEHLLLDETMDLENLQIIDEDLKRCLSRHLKKLAVINCKNLQIVQIGELFLSNIEENKAPSLSNLEDVELRAMPELRWICKGPTQYVSLRSLKFVRIQECNKLESLFSSSLIPSLRLLHISKCDNLEMVFTELESDDETKTSSTPCLQNLESLEIIECPRLRYFLPLTTTQGLPRLQNLKLGGLRNLSSFGPKIYFLRALALKNVEVIDCPGFFNFTIQQDKPLQLKDFEKCIDDVELSNCQLRERSLNLEYTTMKDSDPLIQLPSESKCIILCKLNWQRFIWKVPTQVVVTNLSRLEVWECNNLTYIFPLMLVRNLSNLRILKIFECETLEQIIINDDMSASSSSQGRDEDKMGVKNDKEKLIFPQLQQLCLELLPQLMSFSPVGHHLVFPSLEALRIQGCSPMLTSFTIDSELIVHAKTKAHRLDDVSSSNRDIGWHFIGNPTSLPQYVEEADKISTLK